MSMLREAPDRQPAFHRLVLRKPLVYLTDSQPFEGSRRPERDARENNIHPVDSLPSRG